MAISSRQSGDTVGLQKGGNAVLHQLERGGAEEFRAARERELLEAACRRARHDRLAQLVVQDEQLADRAAALIAGAAALGAAAAGAELPVRDRRQLQARLADDFERRLYRLGALLADEAHETLREDAVQSRDERVGVDLHVREAAEHVEDVVG